MKNKLSVIIIGLIVCFIAISIFFLWWIATKREKPAVPEKSPEVFVQTSEANVRLYFQSANMSLPPSASIRLMLDAGNFRIGFAGLKINFDKTKVRLAGEITSTDKLKTIVRKSTAAEANASGTIILTLGLAVEDRDNPPQGVFELASIPLEAVSTGINETTSFSIQDNSVEIVVILGPDNFSDLTYTKEAAQITLNPSSSPTPTVTPVNSPTPTVTPVKSPTPTTTPVNSPTPTVTPVNSSTPTLTPVNSPTSTPRPSNTPTPTSVVSNTPGPSATIPPDCQKKTLGDANCDGNIDEADYRIWRCFYIGGGHCLGPDGNYDPDFNRDGKVDMIDFEIWRRGRFQ